MRITKDLTVQGFREYAAVIQECIEHPLPALTPEVLASVTRVVSVRMEDMESRIVVELASGQAGILFEWSDTSGHG